MNEIRSPLDINTLNEIDAEFEALMTRLKDIPGLPPENGQMSIGAKIKKYREGLCQHLESRERLPPRITLEEPGEKDWLKGYVAALKMCLNQHDYLFNSHQEKRGPAWATPTKRQKS